MQKTQKAKCHGKRTICSIITALFIVFNLVFYVYRTQFKPTIWISLLNEHQNNNNNSSNYTDTKNINNTKNINELTTEFYNSQTWDSIIVSRPCMISSSSGHLGNSIRRYMQVRAVCFWSKKGCKFPSFAAHGSIFNELCNEMSMDDTKKEWKYALDQITDMNSFELFKNYTIKCNLIQQCNFRQNQIQYGRANICWEKNKFFNYHILREVTVLFDKHKDELMTFNVTKCDITIHQRCGDIINLASPYRFLAYNNYSNGIKTAIKNYKSQTNIDCTENIGNKKYNLNIISQLNSNGIHHDNERITLTICNQYLSNVKTKLSNEFEFIKNNYNINLINNDINNDQYLMFISPIFIYSESTFTQLVRHARYSSNNKVTIDGGGPVLVRFFQYIQQKYNVKHWTKDNDLKAQELLMEFLMGNYTFYDPIWNIDEWTAREMRKQGIIK